MLSTSLVRQGEEEAPNLGFEDMHPRATDNRGKETRPRTDAVKDRKEQDKRGKEERKITEARRREKDRYGDGLLRSKDVERKRREIVPWSSFYSR